MISFILQFLVDKWTKDQLISLLSDDSNFRKNENNK